ncbi:phage tail spike protein [Clostridium perfringens]|uniref:phage tail spike protein n=1 Tax=Clostridium perfringens TaxID=1502 RepID=UPI001ABB53FD|nr:phage tail spike protein [Clostridium perfringens]MBO3389681.1 phage tail protein [Clostridium perfringens]
MTVPNFLRENTELKLKKLNKVDEFGAYFSIPFVTDVHNAETTTYKWLNSIKVIEEVNKRKNINYILTGGDYINNHENKEEVIKRLKNFKDRFEDRSNLFITLGNHDDNSNYKDFSKVITHEEMKKLMFSDMQDVIFGNGLYYYKDFHEHKIRLIVLNSEDIPEYDIGMKYKGQWDYAFSNEQLNWVAHTALNTDYKIILCSHTPLIENVEGFDLAIRNSEAMLGIMKAYTTGTSYSSSNNTGDFKYNVSVDYNKKGTIVCCLFGHVHADNIVYKDNIAHISTTCSNCSYRYGSSAIKNATGTVNEIALDFLTVRNDMGFLTRFGAGSDRSFTYVNNTKESKKEKSYPGIKLLGQNKKIIALLQNLKDLSIESILESGDKTLSFSYAKEDKFYENIIEENYIRTKEDEFVIKSRDIGVDYTRFDCVLNLEELEANIFDRFESVEQTITNAINLAIVGTGWTVNDNTLKKKRTVRCTNKNALEIVKEIKKTYRVDIVFNTLEKKIEVYEKLGEDKGAYFIDSLNLTALQVQSDSYKFATRIIAEGKDNLTFEDINGGKNYVENFQYSKKIKTIYWKDERYTVKESLLEDARAKLEEISKPFTSYNASVLNLAELNPKYKSILDYSLGDTITLLSKSNKVRDKQRIVKTVEYPQDHSRDTVELANAILKFEDIQQENQETTDTVNNITTDNGTVDGSTIDSITTKQIEDFEANVIKVAKLKAILAEIENLHVNKADIQNLNAVIARIGTLEATKASITELNAIHAIIQQIKAGKADITDLNAAVAKVGILENRTAVIENALNKNLTAENIATGAITAGSGIIANGAIGDAEINSLSGNKLKFGTVDTSLVTIAGPNGRLRLQGNKLQIFDNKDGKLYERIMLGVDSNNNSSLILRGADGRTILLDQNGLTKAGITEGFGKIDDNSIDASLIFDKNSMVRSINGATETIRGTKVQIGDRTLDVELGIQSNTITEQGKVLDSQKATITTLQDAIKLKVDNQTFTSATQTINRNILGAKEEAINTANNAINNLQISFRNLAINSNFDFGWKNWGFNNPNNNATVQIIKDSVLGSCVKVSTQSLNQGVYAILKRKPKTTYSWSFMIKSDKPCKINVIHENGEGSKEISLTTEWTKIAGTGIWNGNGGALCFYSNEKNQKVTYYLTNLIYVEGNKVGDWTQAPEDLQGYADEVAKAKADLAQANAIANADGKITEEERKRIQQAQENLNTAIARADKAKTDAIAYSDTLGQQLKANAEKYANDVAIAKAELAKQQSKAYADGVVTEEEKKRIKQAEDNLNTAIAKANEAENKAREYADAKKIEAINKASADAALKAAEALNSAKAFTTAEISTTNSNLHKATAEINILKERIESKVGTADVEKAIQNIEFGGRNLFLKSKGPFKSSNEYVGISITSLVEKYLNKKITISADVKANKVGKIRFYSLGGYSVGFWVERDVTTEWTRIKATGKFTLNDEKQKWCDLSFYGNYGSGLFTEVRNVKIELGELASDYTEAPEDTKQLIVESQNVVTEKIKVVESNLTQTKNSIEASVRDLDSQTKAITTNVTNINNDLINKINTAKGDAINQAKLDAKDYTNAQISTVNTKVHNVESNLNILKEKIESKVGQSDVEKTINSIKFNDINMILNSGEFKGTDHWSCTNGADNLTVENNILKFKFKNYAPWGCYISNDSLLNKPLDIAKDYTIVCKLKASRNQIVTFNICDGNSYNYVFGKELSLTTEWQIFKFTFKPTGKGNERQFRFITSNLGYEFDLYIEFVKMVEGTTTSDNWSIAPDDVVSSIKVVDTKISDVSTKITQLKDSVTIDINSINSKTHTIETNLGGKASKEEVTEVNNRVATIKANLDSITQRVSSTESKTHTLESNLNGKASKQELTVVNNKVTEVTASLNGITQRVGNTESRINALDGKVAGAVTLQQFTEFKQSNDKFKFTVEQRSSVSNILPNSSFHGGDRGWLHGGVEFWAGAYSGYGFKGRITGAIKNRVAYNNPERYLQTHKAYKVKKNTTYTINFHYICEKNVQSMDAFVVLSDTEHGDYAQPICVLTAQGGSQSNAAEEKPFTYKFNTGNHEWVWIRFDHNGMKSGVNWDEFCWIYVSEVGIYEGDVGAVKWTPKGGEVYSANYQMDGLGFKGTFEDGTYASLGKDGLEWYNAGTGHAYHALTYVTSFDIPVGNPGKAYIKLPAEFTKRRSSLKWTVALRGYYYNTTGNFFPFHVHCTGARDYIENGLVVCEVQGLCKIQNGSNSGDVQFRPLTAMLIAIA